MPARNLMIVGLRVVGIWLVVQGVMEVLQIVNLIQTLVRSGSIGGNTHLYPWLAIAAIKLAIAVGLVLRAEWIGRRFYPLGDEELHEVRFGPIGPGDLYRIACFGMGIYVLVATVQALSMLLTGLMQGPFSRGNQSTLMALVQLAVYVPLAGVLIFGSRRIAQALSSLKYDPDAVPNPQFTVLVLLIVMLVFAILLGILRYFAA